MTSSNVVYAENESWKTGSAAKRDRQKQYIEWLITPPAERDPKTKTELAEQLGVTIQTLGNYTREPLFQKQLVREQARLRRVEKADVVMAKLYERAVSDADGSASAANTAAKIWLEYTLNVEDMEEDNAIDVTELDDGEIEQMIVKFLSRRAEG